jgi:hypothetical protein
VHVAAGGHVAAGPERGVVRPEGAGGELLPSLADPEARGALDLVHPQLRDPEARGQVRGRAGESGGARGGGQ